MGRLGGNSKAPAQSTDSALQSALRALMTPELCASEVMETVPLVTRFMRSRVSHVKSAPSIAQIRALGFLTRNPGASLSVVADHLCVTKATASATIERMVQHGLVNRSEDPKERRCVVLTITTAGAKHYQLAREVAQTAVAEVLSQLPESKLREITEGLTVLREAFNESNHRDEK